jgi:TPR repeat protein
LPSARPGITYILRAVALAAVVSSSAIAQSDLSAPVEVPPGVHYKPTDLKINIAARTALSTALGSDHPPAFFSSAVSVGPTLWSALQSKVDKTVQASKPAVLLLQGTQLEMRGLTTDAQRQSFWQTLLATYPALKTAAIRKARPEEINYYWKTIPFDIEEPFFTIDTGETKFIVQFLIEKGQPKLFWIDAVGDIDGRASAFAPVVDLVALKMMAEGGDKGAMGQLGGAYFVGKSVPEDLKQSAVWFDKAARAGSVEAQMILGMGYYSGQKFPMDKALAAKYFKLAADAKNPSAQYSLAAMYQAGDGVPASPEKFMEYLKAAAEQNFPNALYNLGMSYAGGNGVPLDLAKACSLFERAANQNYSLAQNTLGRCYEKGLDRERNNDKAFACYKLAAAGGVADGAGNAATLYASINDGEHVLVWLRIAEDEGAIKNRPAIARVKTGLTPAQVESAEAEVGQWEKAHPAVIKK